MDTGDLAGRIRIVAKCLGTQKVEGLSRGG